MDRRNFLANLSCLLAPGAAAPLLSLEQQPPATAACWLDACAPFIVEDAEKGIHSEIVLTSDTFAGAGGYEDGADVTEYEIHLFDGAGNAMGPGGVAARLTVPAMRTTVVAVRDLVGERKSFWGGMKVRVRPKTRENMHASDLFSSAFVRWRTAGSFDNVHANPDPPQWQNTESYFYSMPFPALGEYECVYSLFNPNDQPSRGEIVVFNSKGEREKALRYELKPHASLLFDLATGKSISQPWGARGESESKAQEGGLLAVINEEGSAKGFGFLMIRQRKADRFSVEHPIHQGMFVPKSASVPFDEKNQFRARNVLYSPLLFHERKISGLTLDTRYYLGTGLPGEAAQWFYPFAVDGRGEIAWSSLTDPKLKASLGEKVERSVIRLTAHQSCRLDFTTLSLDPDFAGGLAIAVTPDLSHTMFKVEIRVREWNAHAFTHFRPGLRSARGYQKAGPRGGLITDYIVSGARCAKNQFDELIGVMNIDDKGFEARPTLEIHSARGLLGKAQLGAVKPFACRHFLLSDLLSGAPSTETMTLRLIDEKATLLLSAMHIDFTRRDIALDHGSDRFSTFLDYGCTKP